MPGDEQVFVIEGGTITTLYHDDLVQLGQNKIERASIVEPDENGKWFVQLTDSELNGEHKGKLIGSGFNTRQEALDFEVNFINEQILKKM